VALSDLSDLHLFPPPPPLFIFTVLCIHNVACSEPAPLLASTCYVTVWLAGGLLLEVTFDPLCYCPVCLLCFSCAGGGDVYGCPVFSTSLIYFSHSHQGYILKNYNNSQQKKMFIRKSEFSPQKISFFSLLIDSCSVYVYICIYLYVYIYIFICIYAGTCTDILGGRCSNQKKGHPSPK